MSILDFEQAKREELEALESYRIWAEQFSPQALVMRSATCPGCGGHIAMDSPGGGEWCHPPSWMKMQCGVCKSNFDRYLVAAASPFSLDVRVRDEQVHVTPFGEALGLLRALRSPWRVRSAWRAWRRIGPLFTTLKLEIRA